MLRYMATAEEGRVPNAIHALSTLQRYQQSLTQHSSHTDILDMCLHVCVRVYVYVYRCQSICMYVYMYIHIYTYTYICSPTHVLICVLDISLCLVH